MPEIVPHRVGTLFYHRDTRLKTEQQHPVVVKSVDVTDLSTRFKRRQIRFDYGYGGDGQLYVEVSVYRPRPYLHWMHQYFDVKKLIDFGKHAGLARLARLLRIPQARLITAIVAQAPWKEVADMDNLEDYAQEFGEDAAFDLLVSALIDAPASRN